VCGLRGLHLTQSAAGTHTSTLTFIPLPSPDDKIMFPSTFVVLKAIRHKTTPTPLAQTADHGACNAKVKGLSSRECMNIKNLFALDKILCKCS